MSRTTITRTTITARIRRSSLSLFAVTLASAIALAAPAAAAPQGPAQVVDQLPGLDPELPPGGGNGDEVDNGTAGIDHQTRCEPAPGVDYVLTAINGPDRPWTGSVDWSNLDTGDGGAVNGPAGSIDTGEGQVELVGTIVYPALPVVQKGGLPSKVLPAIVVTSDPVVVTITCEDPDDGDEDDDEADGGDEPGTEVESGIVQGTPNFTG